MLTLRLAQPQDAPALQAHCWPHQNIPYIRAWLHRIVARPYQRGWVACWEGVAVGFGLLTLLPNLAEISELIVAPSHRGQGMGTRLILQLCQEAHQVGITRLDIGVAQSNLRAKQLYLRLGFCYQKTRYLDFGQGTEPIDYLCKDLSALGEGQAGDDIKG